MVDWLTFALNQVLAVVTGAVANIVSHHLLPRRVPDDRTEGRVVPSLWSFVFIAYVVGALYLIEGRWLMPLGHRILVVVATAGGIVMLSAILRWIGRRPWEELLIVTLVPALAFPLVDPVFPRGVDMTCPSIVGDDEVVRGLVAGERWQINLLVHPLKVPDWWVQQVPISDRRRQWEARAVFGGGPGDRFQLLAIAVPEGPLFREGDVIRAEQIPSAAFKSRLCEVGKQ